MNMNINTNIIAKSISDTIADTIAEQIKKATNPLKVLAYALNQYGQPILTFGKVFIPYAEFSLHDVCYGVYLDKYTDNKKYGEEYCLKSLERNTDDNDIFECYVIDYLAAFKGDDNDNIEERFARHFLSAIDVDYDEILRQIMSNIMQSI